VQAVLDSILIITPVVLTYFLVIKGVDRYEPEPWWLLIGCFLWGVFGATFFALIGNAVGEVGVSAALNADFSDPLVSASTASFVAPLVEESTKGVLLLVLWGLSALWLRELDGPLDGAIYGGVIGLGFTLTEDILYVSQAGIQHGTGGLITLFILRTAMAGLGHATFTAMTGLGVGFAAESSSLLLKLCAPVAGWCAAVSLHFLHNFLVTFAVGDGEGFIAKLILFWVFDAVFFVMLFVLVMRDRAIVVRGLVDEVGKLLHPREFRRTISYMMVVPLWNLFCLLGSPGGYFDSRRKQQDLVKLAFVKRRRQMGQTSLDAWETELRTRIQRANHAGVFIGSR
jgi:RsiW-degrading membrane proteinase PrsW (M82 family)